MSGTESNFNPKVVALCDGEYSSFKVYFTSETVSQVLISDIEEMLQDGVVEKGDWLLMKRFIREKLEPYKRFHKNRFVPVPANERSSITSDKPSADKIILIAGKILNLRGVVVSSAGPILHGNINISMNDVLAENDKQTTKIDWKKVESINLSGCFLQDQDMEELSLKNNLFGSANSDCNDKMADFLLEMLLKHNALRCVDICINQLVGVQGKFFFRKIIGLPQDEQSRFWRRGWLGLLKEKEEDVVDKDTVKVIIETHVEYYAKLARGERMFDMILPGL
ncbi:hypothetical protein MP638_000013 [Amoeboaphelidium occidentale]|nr:hypothetical protein MP638_000013 [Amoeboaphelidium occidentale]